MLQQVIDTLEKESEKNINDMTVRRICNHVIEKAERGCIGEDDINNIISKTKTIAGAITKMREAANKVAVNNCGVLTDEEGFDIVNKYFAVSEQKMKQAKKKQDVKSIFDLM